MKQIKIKDLSLPSNPEIEKRVIVGLIILIMSLGVMYGYFVKQTILNVVLRKEIGETIIDLGSEVSGLEVSYIELKNKISLDFAYSLGYKDIPEVKFVSRSKMEKTLTLNNN